MNSRSIVPYTDVPIDDIYDDKFLIVPYINALSSFIRNSETPITIAIQGEWGCGKTSFMNLLKQQLCAETLPDQERFEPIMINAWEYFLEDDYDQAVAGLTRNVIGQMAEHFENLQRKHISAKRKEVAKQVADILAKAVFNITNVGCEPLEGIKEVTGSFSKASNTVLYNKTQLEEAIVKDDSCKAFIIFVDDLDRLPPKMAVTMMEALKILLDIKKCVFVVAVDYEVIENGIELKYGRSIVGNRDIARDFFDKLIQLPFQIPMRQYRIRNYLQEQLKQIGFFLYQRDYIEYIGLIEEIFILATGKNPRTMKSILNLFQALDLMDGKANDNPEFQMMELLLVVFQKCYPDIYLLLAENNILVKWEVGYGKEIPEDAVIYYDLDIPWKKRVYILFENDPIGRKKIKNIFRLLEIYEFLQNRCEDKGEQYMELFTLINLIGNRPVDQGVTVYDGREYDKHSDIQKKQGNRLIRTLDDFSIYRTVLDVGCGNGKTTIEMWKRNPSMRITAIDNSRSQLEVAIEHFENVSIDRSADWDGWIDFAYENALNISSVNKYDLVFSNAALHWIGKSIYPVLFRSLQPGGTLAVHQGGKGTYHQLHEAARRTIDALGLNDYYEDWELPLYYPDKLEMEVFLNECGFDSIYVDQDISVQKADESLVDAFIAASLPTYLAELPDESAMELKSYFRNLCLTEVAEVMVSRLYIIANKPLIV